MHEAKARASSKKAILFIAVILQKSRVPLRLFSFCFHCNFCFHLFYENHVRISVRYDFSQKRRIADPHALSESQRMRRFYNLFHFFTGNANPVWRRKISIGIIFAVLSVFCCILGVYAGQLAALSRPTMHKSSAPRLLQPQFIISQKISREQEQTNQ